MTRKKGKMRMCGFSRTTLFLGMEIAILCNIAAVVIYTYAGRFEDPFRIVSLSDTLAKFGLKALVLAAMVGFAGDIVMKLKQREKQK